jgi:hypothetical protein
MHRRAYYCPNDYARITLSAPVRALGTSCARGRNQVVQ